MELCEPPHSSDANYEHMGMCNILAPDRGRTCFRSKILLVSCILSAFSFRALPRDSSASCWNTDSRRFFRNASQRQQHRTTSVLLHSSEQNSNKTDVQLEGHRRFSNTGELMATMSRPTAKILKKTPKKQKTDNRLFMESQVFPTGC